MGLINKPASSAATLAAHQAALKAKAAAQQTMTSPTAVGAANFVTRMEKVKQMEAMKKVRASVYMLSHVVLQIIMLNVPRICLKANRVTKCL